ncbi:T9SS type A sorting domain-containing protein [Flavobacterium sp. JAS]|uniref:T9SS type A sorting domain-containing protein n=1 Tax=Flavobacterium sp. JAS TaxID=2897329 RepID=UPI001E507133|nr:T9SS type A sorting domain-containing protein [Flavobacterium sp. JAS]MCD0468906.1 T9SS type A sorting domain-containing protein [Flavobacterium sp. JAS]
MRKNYFYLLFLFLSTTISFAQKVTITPTSVNGSNVNAGPINLASVPYSSVSLGVKVEIPDGASVDDQGTIKIYYMNSVAIGPNVAIGGDGGALYFGGAKVANRSFTINLNWADFQTSGGFIYAEYKNMNSPSGAVFKSAYLSVIKNATVTTGTNLNPPADAPNPTKITNTLCCDQTVRLGEKPAPVTGTTYLNPYQNEPYGINSSWQAAGLGSVRFISNNRSTLEIDNITELGKSTVTRSLGYNYGGQFPNKSNSVTITVVPSPITPNEIRINASINTDGSSEINNANPKDIFGDNSSINLNILQDPFYVPKRGDTNVMIDKYEWEYRITNGTTEDSSSWITIPNQSSPSLNSSYLPRSNSDKDNFYLLRRIAIYQNLKIASNSLKISLRAIRDNNTICCDQTLEVSSSNIVERPSTITGTTTVSNKNTYLFYQWQSQTVTERGAKFSNWTNIPYATSKDYFPSTPEFVPGVGRNQPTVPTYNYRRIATDNIYTGETYYSNEVSLIPSTNVYSTSTLKIYPNPATSIINIENTYNRTGGIDLNDANINIVNITGNIVNLNDFTKITPTLISINVSNLVNGIYFINVSNNRSGRSYTEQFTFIKN